MSKNRKNSNYKTASGTVGRKKTFAEKLRGNILLFNRKGESRLYLFLSFVIPFLIIWFFFRQNEVHPFGTKQILVTDLWHQYYPFFRVEHEKLQNLSSLLYSWETGLGTNFISLMSYYAASPLNFLAVFFPLEYSRDALTLFLTLKIAFAGLFFAIFLKHTFNKNDFSITGFAICFALCDFIMGYYWNIIWIDTVAILPLVVLGTVKLYREGRYKLYVLSLAAALMTSFYIGLFICIFTVMVFAALVIIDWGGFKYALKRLGQISGATVLGIGIGALILLPAFLALKLTVSVNNTFPQDIIYYEPWLKMISNVIGFHEPTAKEGLPNFYCGMVALALIGVYLCSFGIKIREKVITVIYLAFIVVSCNMNVLNFMWHGFHFTNMLPYRFSFLLSFIVLASGYRAYTVMKEEKKVLNIVALSAMAVVMALVSRGNQPEKAIISSIVVCLVFTFLMFLFELNVVKENWLNFLVMVVCGVEMGMNAKIGVETVTTTDYVSYPRKNSQITALIDNLEESDNGFYRIETTTNYSINDPALYGYRGVSQFSSTANVNVTNLMKDIGVDASDIGNRYYYNQNTAFVNMLLNLKYLISTERYSGDLTYLEAESELDRVSVYRNNHYLPIGFFAEEDTTDFAGGKDNQFENQNELFSLMTGIDDDLFERLDIKDVGHKGLEVVKTGYGTYTYSYSEAPDQSGDCYLKYNYTVKHDGPVYIAFNFTDATNLRIKNGDTVLNTKNLSGYLSVFAAGEYSEGDTATFQTDIPADKSGSGSIFVYQINKDVFEEGYKKLSGGTLDVTDYGDTHIEGSIDMPEDGIMYTSIPYDGGWRVYSDGKRVGTESLKNAFVCVPLSKGSHKIVMKYTPPGFAAGTAISIMSLAVFVLLWIYGPRITAKAEARRLAKAPAEETPSEEETASAEEEDTGSSETPAEAEDSPAEGGDEANEES